MKIFIELISGLGCILLIGYFVFNVIAKDLKKEKPKHSSFESLDHLEERAENISAEKESILNETKNVEQKVEKINKKLKK